MGSEGQISRGHSMLIIGLLEKKKTFNVFFLLKQCEDKEEETFVLITNGY